MADLALGARAVVQDDAALLSTYRTVAADLRRSLMLADIAAEHGHGRRAAEHITGALADLAPELAALLRLDRSP
jgi:hypothetical protein